MECREAWAGLQDRARDTGGGAQMLPRDSVGCGVGCRVQPREPMTARGPPEDGVVVDGVKGCWGTGPWGRISEENSGPGHRPPPHPRATSHVWAVGLDGTCRRQGPGEKRRPLGFIQVAFRSIRCVNKGKVLVIFPPPRSASQVGFPVSWYQKPPINNAAVVLPLAQTLPLNSSWLSNSPKPTGQKQG